MTEKRRRTGVEWVGGIVTMPAYITGEGEPYRPEALFWIDADGMMLGTAVERPGELLPAASECLQETIEHPMFGRPHAPARLRVASPGLADALRAGHPGIEVVCAPTPELDALVAHLRAEMEEDDVAAPSYLSSGVGPDAVASFFSAAADLYRALPWQAVPDDQSLFSVTSEALGLHAAALSVIGQMGQSYGLVLFSGLDDFEAYLDAAEAVEQGAELALPPHISLNFERGAELADGQRKEVAQHGWEVADPNAYPWLMAVDAELVARPPSAREVTMFEAVARALTGVLAEKEALHAAWHGGEPVSRTVSVPTHAGEIELTLATPYVRAPVEYGPAHGVLAELFALARDGDEIDFDARRLLEDELLRRFADSPEAEGLPELFASGLVMHYTADYLGESIATLDSSGLREVLFELFPRKVSIGAPDARAVVEEVRAFYGFLQREFGLEQADACLRVLGANAVSKLEAALSDSSNFGMAKSLVMAGREAGFEVDTPEGIEAWMRTVQGMPLPPLSHQSGSRKAAKAKKEMRKAARKARKRNR